MLDIMAENSADTGGSVSKERVSSDFCATLYSTLSLKSTDNVVYTVVQKSLHIHSGLCGFCATLYMLASVYVYVTNEPYYLNSSLCTLVRHRNLVRWKNLSY